MADNKVKFLRGTSNEYAVAKKDSDTIYFTTDDGKLYIGDKEVSGESIKALNSHINDNVKHITSTERTNWNAAKTHADSAHAPSNAQANVIETVKVNGTALTPSSKAVDITVPSVGNGTITIKQAGTTKGTFTTNQNGNTTIELTDNNTWRDVVDNLASTDTTKSLSANQGKVLKGLVDGKASSSHTHNAMIGATSDAAGTSGFVPAPAVDDIDKFLCGDGTWKSLSGGDGNALTVDTLLDIYLNKGSSLSQCSPAKDSIINLSGNMTDYSFIYVIGCRIGSYDNPNFYWTYGNSHYNGDNISYFLDKDTIDKEYNMNGDVPLNIGHYFFTHSENNAIDIYLKRVSLSSLRVWYANTSYSYILHFKVLGIK